MVFLLTCKNEEGTFKNKGTRVVTTFRCQKSDLVEIRTCPSVYGSPGYLQEKEDPMKNEESRVPTKLLYS